MATHEQLSQTGRDLTQLRVISLWDVARPFRFQVVGADNLSHGNVEALYVEAGMFVF